MSGPSTAHPTPFKGTISISQKQNGPEPDEGPEVPPANQDGEDDGSTSVEGDDDHLHEDQKPLT